MPFRGIERDGAVIVVSRLIYLGRIELDDLGGGGDVVEVVLVWD